MAVSKRLLGTQRIHSNHSYKSGGALEAHFGLGKATSVDLSATLLDGRKRTFEGPPPEVLFSPVPNGSWEVGYGN